MRPSNARNAFRFHRSGKIFGRLVSSPTDRLINDCTGKIAAPAIPFANESSRPPNRVAAPPALPDRHLSP